MDLLRLVPTDAEKDSFAAIRSESNIARAVLHQRLEQDLSQTELAQKAGTTQARVSEVEAMKGDPKLSTLSRIARALGCMIDMVPIAEPKPLVTTNWDAMFDAVANGATEFVNASPSTKNVVRVLEGTAA